MDNRFLLSIIDLYNNYSYTDENKEKIEFLGFWFLDEKNNLKVYKMKKILV